MANKVKDFVFVVFSALLLILAFPYTDIWFLALFALIPFFFVLDYQKPSKAFGLSYLFGAVFFSGTLYWFIHVTLPGMILLVLILSIYFGLFGLAYSFFQRESILWKLLIIPSLWVAMEFLRANLFSVFGWVSLGHSQYKNLPLIQIADMTGIYGVSFLLVLINFILKEIFKGEKKISTLVIILVSVLGIVLGYGFIRLNENTSPQGTLSVAVVQANTPQDLKWNEDFWPMIMDQYLAMTQEAARENPQLVIWPETAFPGFLGRDDDLFVRIKDALRAIKIPLLFGSVVQDKKDYYNSAILLSKDAMPIGQYHKTHLVPFGEYIPFRYALPFLSNIIPIADFTEGEQLTVFNLADIRSNPKFSALICFEDTVPSISRGLVQKGAQFLINITNDAWFENSRAPFMHLQAAVFRTIENRRWLVRAANTGVSGFIDSHGRIVKSVRDDRGKMTYIAGVAVAKVGLNTGETFYTKFGDIFVCLCGALMAVGFLKKTNLRLFS